MSRLSLPLLALVVAGCGGSSPLVADDLARTTWAEHCPGSDPDLAYLRLDPDGTFAWSYSDPDAVETDSGDTWAIEGTTLIISWNDGFAVTTYDLRSFDTGRLQGSSTKTCGDAASFERV